MYHNLEEMLTESKITPQNRILFEFIREWNNTITISNKLYPPRSSNKYKKGKKLIRGRNIPVVSKCFNTLKKEDVFEDTVKKEKLTHIWKKRNVPRSYDFYRIDLFKLFMKLNKKRITSLSKSTISSEFDSKGKWISDRKIIEVKEVTEIMKFLFTNENLRKYFIENYLTEDKFDATVFFQNALENILFLAIQSDMTFGDEKGKYLLGLGKKHSFSEFDKIIGAMKEKYPVSVIPKGYANMFADMYPNEKIREKIKEEMLIEEYLSWFSFLISNKIHYVRYVFFELLDEDRKNRITIFKEGIDYGIAIRNHPKQPISKKEKLDIHFKNLDNPFFSEMTMDENL